MPAENRSVACRSAARSPMGENANDRLNHMAQLIADGEVSFPQDLNSDDEAKLLTVVRSLMRKRLVRFIAKQIAREVHCDSRKATGREG